MDSEQKETLANAEYIKSLGFRVFLAESGTHGCYTDKHGSRVVSFQYDLCGFNISGNYEPCSNGTGWRISNRPLQGISETLSDILYKDAPHWAVGNTTVTYTTLERYLKMYQASKYTEI